MFDKEFCSILNTKGHFFGERVGRFGGCCAAAADADAAAACGKVAAKRGSWKMVIGFLEELEVIL